MSRKHSLPENSQLVKFNYNSEVHKFVANNVESYTYKALVEEFCDIYDISPNVQITFTYVDKEGDIVSITKDRDIRVALMYLRSITIHAAAMSSEATESTTTLDGESTAIRCHNCNAEVFISASVQFGVQSFPNTDVQTAGTSAHSLEQPEKQSDVNEEEDDFVQQGFGSGISAEQLNLYNSEPSSLKRKFMEASFNRNGWDDDDSDDRHLESSNSSLHECVQYNQCHNDDLQGDDQQSNAWHSGSQHEAIIGREEQEEVNESHDWEDRQNASVEDNLNNFDNDQISVCQSPALPIDQHCGEENHDEERVFPLIKVSDLIRPECLLTPLSDNTRGTIEDGEISEETANKDASTARSQFPNIVSRRSSLQNPINVGTFQNVENQDGEKSLGLEEVTTDSVHLSKNERNVENSQQLRRESYRRLQQSSRQSPIQRKCQSERTIHRKSSAGQNVSNIEDLASSQNTIFRSSGSKRSNYQLYSDDNYSTKRRNRGELEKEKTRDGSRSRRADTSRHQSDASRRSSGSRFNRHVTNTRNSSPGWR